MKLLSKIALVLLALAVVAPYAEARGCRGPHVFTRDGLSQSSSTSTRAR